MSRRVAGVVGAVATVALVAGCGAGSSGGDATRASSAAPPASVSTPVPSSSTAVTATPSTASTPTSAAPIMPAPATSGGGGIDATVPLTPGSTLPAVPVGSPASAGGVTVTVSRVESVQGEAQGPGQVAGPAVRLTIVIRDATARALPLDAVTVDLRDAADVSAPPLSGPGRRPFTGSAPAGGSATGVYVFGLATNARADVTVRLTYDGSAPTVVFRGAV